MAENEGAVLPDNPSQAELDAAPVAELDKFLDRQNPPAPAEKSATVEPKSENTGEAAEKPADDQPEWFKRYVEDRNKRDNDLNRELKGLRSLNGLKDKMPQLMREELKRLQQEQARQSQIQNMSPEEKAAFDDQTKQMEALEKLIDQRAEAKLKSEAGPALEFYKEQAQKQEYLAKVADAVGGQEQFAAIYPAFQSLFDQKIAEINGDDPSKAEAAEQWYNQAIENPYFLIHHATRMQSQQIQAKGKAFINEREAAGREASQSVRSDGVKVSGKKSLENMSQEELDAMSVEELNAAFDEAEKAGKAKRR